MSKKTIVVCCSVSLITILLYVLAISSKSPFMFRVADTGNILLMSFLISSPLKLQKAPKWVTFFGLATVLFLSLFISDFMKGILWLSLFEGIAMAIFGFIFARKLANLVKTK